MKNRKLKKKKIPLTKLSIGQIIRNIQKTLSDILNDLVNTRFKAYMDLLSLQRTIDFII